MRIFTLAFLLVGGCAHVRWLQSEHPSPPTMECAQTMRIFPYKFADRVVDAVVFSLLVFATFLLTTSASTSLFGAAFFDVVEEVEDSC